MKKQIINAIATYAMAAGLLLPLSVILIDSVTAAILGAVYAGFLFRYLFRTVQGRWFFRRLTRAAKLLDKVLLPE